MSSAQATRPKPSPVALRPVDAARSQVTPAAIHQVLSAGNLADLSEQDRIVYYIETCENLGLNWRTTPFIITTVGKGGMSLYLTVNGAEQLAEVNEISVRELKSEEVKGAYIVTMEATMPNGRSVTKKGGKPIQNLAGEAYIDAVKKAESQAFRRAVKACASLNTHRPYGERAPSAIPTMRQEDFAAAAQVIAAAVIDPAEDPAAENEPAEPEISDAQFTPLEESPLRVAKGRFWSMCKQRGFTQEIEAQAVATLMGVELAVATVDELNHLTQQLVDHPDAKELLEASGQVERMKQERSEDPMTRSDS